MQYCLSAVFILPFVLLGLYCYISFPFQSKQFHQRVEIFFQYYTYTLRVQRRLGEVSVIRLVVHFQSNIAVRQEQVIDVEVTYERCCGILAVAIAELSVYYEAVVEKAA